MATYHGTGVGRGVRFNSGTVFAPFVHFRRPKLEGLSRSGLIGPARHSQGLGCTLSIRTPAGQDSFAKILSPSAGGEMGDQPPRHRGSIDGDERLTAANVKKGF